MGISGGGLWQLWLWWQHSVHHVSAEGKIGTSMVVQKQKLDQKIARRIPLGLVCHIKFCITEVD